MGFLSIVLPHPNANKFFLDKMPVDFLSSVIFMMIRFPPSFYKTVKWEHNFAAFKTQKSESCHWPSWYLNYINHKAKTKGLCWD